LVNYCNNTAFSLKNQHCRGMRPNLLVLLWLLVLFGLHACTMESVSELTAALERHGWLKGSRLAALADLPEAELERGLEDDLGLPPGHLPSLLGRMDTAAVQSQLDNRFLAFASTAALFCDARAASSSSMAGALLSEGGCFAVPVLRGAARVSRWPTRLARKLAAAGDCLEMRDKVEDRERGRWVEALYLLLVRAQFPAVMDHAGQLTIPFSRKRFAKGRRPATCANM
jgi:hypothetical protein